jgi:hypothetical protein
MNRLRLSIRLRPPALPIARSRPTRRRAARIVLAFAAFALVLNVGFAAYMDYGPPRLRDPEYGKRLAALKARLKENPGRPLVLVVGSSRCAMGVRPGVLEEDGGDPHRPLLFNLSLAGSGPVMELMVVRRMLADGIQPAAVLIEYWPAFLREDGPYWEQSRIDVNRLRPVDVPLIRDYFHEPEKTERQMLEARLLPWYGHRFSLMNQFAASWLPMNRRTEAMFTPLDGWGWLPGRERAEPEQRKTGLAAAAGYYRPLFEHYSLSPVADQAMRQAVAECRASGATVGLVYLPEASEFRALVPPRAAALAEDHLTKLRSDLNLPLIDARHWAADDDLPDGFHLCQPAAAAFTKKLGPAVAATFPTLSDASAMRR